MDERTNALALGGELDEDFRVELGTLVAALSAWTEDETELDLGLRAFIESGRVFVTPTRAEGADRLAPAHPSN